MSISEVLALDKYYIILWPYFKIFATTRNGIFFGLPYLFFGYLIGKNKEQVLCKNYFILSLLGFIVMTAEGFYLFKKFENNGQDMLLMLLPTSIFIFLSILFLDSKNNTKNA